MRPGGEIRERQDVKRNQAELRPDDDVSFAQLRAEYDRLHQELLRAEWRIAELEARADIDPLLDVLNRRGFERELKRSLAYVARYGTPGVLIFIDLDGFKAVNDRHGHAVGDKLLRAVAAELAGHVRASDVVGRLGGDEFGVVMWNIGAERAQAKARELEAIIEAASIIQGPQQLSVGASAGTVALDITLEPAALIDAADRAMYARKRAKRDAAPRHGL
jgi:diguanylate cyclase (GGDEF)-like protein